MTGVIVDYGRQSLGRALTASEAALASGLEAIFATGTHDFADVTQQLQLSGVPKPSGAASPWTIDTLQEELRLINAALDAAYRGGSTQPGSADNDR